MIYFAMCCARLGSSRYEREHDYNAICAGSAGCVIANRLSEDGRAAALLLEAGRKDTKPEIRAPPAQASLLNSKVDRADATENEASLNSRGAPQPHGKDLG